MPDPHTKKNAATKLMDQLNGAGQKRRNAVNQKSIISDLRNIRNEAVNLLRTIAQAGSSVANDARMNTPQFKDQTLRLSQALLKDSRSLEQSIQQYDVKINNLSSVSDLDVLFNDALTLTQEIAVTIENYQGACVPMVEELFALQQQASAQTTETPSNE